MHGTTMMFLFAVPVMEAFAVYLVPLMVGTRNIAFPRLNAFSYYVYLSGGLMIWLAFALDIGAENGWFSYVPLAGPEFSPGKRSDFWAQMRRSIISMPEAIMTAGMAKSTTKDVTSAVSDPVSCRGRAA